MMSESIMIDLYIQDSKQKEYENGQINGTCKTWGSWCAPNGGKRCMIMLRNNVGEFFMQVIPILWTSKA